MDFDKLKKELIRDEGLKLKPYRCTAGKLTIGIGRNLDDKGISEAEALVLLENDISECVEDCKAIFGTEWYKFSDARKRVFVNMRFNLGGGTFMTFKSMINHAKRHEYEMVAYHMIHSRWRNQVGERAQRLIRMMREG